MSFVPEKLISTPDSEHVWQVMHEALDADLLVAHANDDRFSLVSLYIEAADVAEKHNDTLAARFYLTQAFVFALDTDHADCLKIQMRLDDYDEKTITCTGI